jgi:uncharacterized Fe-S cluster-containing radical SAM superfamily enzyme
MNRYMENKWSWIEGTHAMRAQLLEAVNNTDLSFNPGGNALPLGDLFREIGEIEHAYVVSLQTLKQDFGYRYDDATIAQDTVRLAAWYKSLDEAMHKTVSAFSDAELDKMIERAEGFSLPVETQLDVYLQALLIFVAKVSIYLRIMSKPLPEGFEGMIG